MARAAVSSIDGEDCDVQRHGAYVWEMSTRNAWTLKVAGIHVGSVRRSPSWRRYHEQRPWRVEIFGSHFGLPSSLSGDKNWFRTLDQARLAAEKALRSMVLDLSRALGA